MIEVPSPGKVETSHKKTPNILVVDDEYNIRSMLQEVLEMNGYEVQTAANGKEG
ncbi:MAG: DNA-binding response regulator, partial [Nitrosopumilaceae archaeon]|nr:response regulator transcription factor [Nitrosopumilaceae archaeon]NIU86823.1 DNA-binding response regulator [Nitrosopumilaceae archaeon]NIV65482.1 DNA-binding response regulator [Nitrosopumilaceae archaeon]NIX62433.1 DNA-binding response regulator [Nitrosopumilaceae archaeon]